MGASTVEVETDAASAIERRVPLPSRWLRGFLEVQAIQAELAPAAELDGARARAFFRSIPKSPVEAAGLGRAGRSGTADVPPRSRSGSGSPGRSCPPRPVRARRPSRHVAPRLRCRRRRQHRLAAGRAGRAPDARAQPRGVAWLLRRGPCSPPARGCCAGCGGRLGARCPGLGTAARCRGARSRRPAGRGARSRALSRRSPCPGSSATTWPTAASSGASCRSISSAWSACSRDSATRAALSSGCRPDRVRRWRGDRRLGRRRRWRRVSRSIDGGRLELHVPLVRPPPRRPRTVQARPRGPARGDR